MLPSWQNRLEIAIAPTQLKLVYSKRRTRDISLHAELPVVPCANGDADWLPVLGTLEEWLRENISIAKRVSVMVTVADCYARYALIPWPGDLMTKSELATYSQLHFADLFGSTVANWQIKTDWVGYGQPGIACALDNELITAMHELMSKYSMPLTSLCPNFVLVFNQWRRVAQSEALLAVVDSGQCTFASFQGKQWRSIRSTRLQCIEAELGAAIEREILLQGLTEQVPVSLHISDSAAAGQMPSLGGNVELIGNRMSSALVTEARSIVPEPC